MTILLKIGIVFSFSIMFFAIITYINSILKKNKIKREKLEDKNINLLNKSKEKVEESKKNYKKSKYFKFHKVFPQYNYAKYQLLKIGIGGSLFLILTLIFNFVFGIGGFLLGYNLPDTVADYIAKKRINKFEIQLIDGLTLIANALKAGASFNQAVEVMIRETKPPISVEFEQFLKETRMGASVSIALENLSKRIESEELKIAVVSINIAREAGGNLSEILLHIADTIRERERLKGKIDALTAQGKTSGIVIGFLPVLVALVLYEIDPIMMYPLFHTFMGQMVLLIVFIMEFVGFKWINKIINIDI